MSDLYRLVYASRNLILGEDAEIAAAVLQILETSKRNNQTCGVSGALLFNKGAFAQVLEGPREAVEQTFERIQRDTRHGDVTVLQCGPAATRGFANWSMAFVGHSQHGQAMWNDLAAESGFDLSRMSGDAVFGMLHDLVIDEEGISDKNTMVGTGFQHEAEHPALDTVQVRAELAELRTTAAPAVKPTAAKHEGAGHAAAIPDSPMAVLKASLASERQRTSQLRAELDEAHIALAVNHDRMQALRQEKDMWAERARLLARALDGAADATLSSSLQEGSVTHDRGAGGSPGSIRTAA